MRPGTRQRTREVPYSHAGSSAVLTYLRNLQTERDTLTQTATTITETAARDERDVTETERGTLTSMATRCAEIDDQLRTFGAQLESERAYARLRQDLDEVDGPPRAIERRGGGDHHGASLDLRGWGERFVESAEFRGYQGVGSSGRVVVPHTFETRAPIDTVGIGGLPVPPQTVAVAQPSFTTPLLDACGHISTSSQVVQWLLDDGTYPHAAVVPEGSAKPEANFILDTATGTLQTYAHYKGVTRQALSNLPLIQSIIENKLKGGIYAKIEADIAAALAAATLGGSEVDAATGGLLAAIRVGIGTAQAQGFPNANSVLLNPADWASLDLDVFNGTSSAPARQSGFWGLNPIASAAIPVGTVYVGDLKQGVTVFDEGQAALYMSDSHQDYFVKNILVILSEVMALPMITAPGALVRVSDSTPDVPPAGA